MTRDQALDAAERSLTLARTDSAAGDAPAATANAVQAHAWLALAAQRDRPRPVPDKITTLADAREQAWDALNAWAEDNPSGPDKLAGALRAMLRATA